MAGDLLMVAPTKRKKSPSEAEDVTGSNDHGSSSISPPPLKRRTQAPHSEPRRSMDSQQYVPSPFRLTRIRGLTSAFNHDTVSLGDLIGDPLITECWIFDFLFDVDFVMQHFDPDIRGLVKVKIVHGSWRYEDSNRKGIEEALKRHPNVESVTAYMPEAYGCHHTKMMVLFRNDDTAQIIIHTANMIAQDWSNLCQGVWVSPRLPMMPKNAQARTADEGSLHESKAQEHSPGSGPQFKSDLLRYLAAYGQKRTGPLVDQLKVYDFSTAKVALVASVPSSLFNDKDRKQTDWGWPALRKILSLIPSTTKQTERPCIVAQVSSVATLGERWISHFFDLLSTTRPNLDSPAEKSPLKPKCRIMFPTAEEVRLSLDGYASGSSIHTKLKSAPAKKQLSLLRPMLVHWSGEKGGSNPPSQLMLSSGQTASESNQTSKTREAGRDRAAPHIKTYIRFANEAMDSIDWALLSSANLSTQAWGAMEKDGKVRICSYEIGVVVWPGLFENNINVLQVSDERHSSEHAGMKNPKGEEENSSSETESDPPDSTSHESSSTDKGTFTADSTLPAGLGKSSKEKLPAAEPPQNDNESETESDPEPSTSIPETKREHQSIMVPTFMKDKPSLEEQDAGSASSKAANPASKTTVGLRLPYNLPLVPYHLDEDPWGKELDYEEPDSKGVVWTST